MTSVPSRFSEASATALTCSGRLSTPTMRSVPVPCSLILKPNLVAILTLPRIAFSALPSRISFSYGP